VEGFLGRFSAIARARPHGVAIDAGGSDRRAIRFADLENAAAGLAARLRELAGGHERPVALLIDKSPELVIAELAAWWCGAAWLPLDPADAVERLRFMLLEVRPALLVAGRAHRALAAELGAGLGAPTVDPNERGAVRTPPNQDDPERLAYLIYTSGSTGRPKGVRVPHRGLVPLLDAQIEAFRLGPGKRALFYLSPAFDASISDIGTALLSGATLVIEPPEALAPGELARTVARSGITHLDLPPALLAAISPDSMPASLETVIIGGEAAPPAAVRAWARRFRVINVYGPTEATICSSLCACDETWSRPLLGRPLPGVTFSVRNVDLAPVPPGTPGELCIAGRGLAQGYLQRPELEREKFVERQGQRFYRTGDRVVAGEDGEVEILGRIDRQLKLRGLLVAPEEIESRLASHPAVAEAAVERLDDRLVAFVAPAGSAESAGSGSAGSAGSANEARLRTHLRLSLPAWLVPGRVVFLDSLPRGTSG
jgi:amino acid adenylation domain-containing protein